jgi:electron transfer flavoprotein alpha/beta subunit
VDSRPHSVRGDVLKIIVFIKSVLDTKIPLECVEGTHTLKQDWNVSILNPDDEAAIAAVLKIRNEDPGTHITVVHLGPPPGERFIKEAIALGCDDGLRIWDERLGDIRSEGKALVFSRVAEILGFDLLVTGTKSLDTETGQVGVLLASLLQVPCIARVIGINAIRKDCIEITRNLDWGFRQRIESARPLVLAIEADEGMAMEASFPDVVQAAERDIPCCDLSRIGISRQALRRADSRRIHGPLRFPAPRLQFVQPPDSSLPAFERRLRLGKSLAAKREGNVVELDVDSAAKELFQILLREGWLNHLRKSDPKA